MPSFEPTKVSPPIELETERFRLRQWRDSDGEPFAALNGDPRVMEFFPSTLNRKASDEAVARLQSVLDERGWGLWAVETRSSQEFIGFAGLQIPKAQLPFSPCVEIGWRLAFPHWGRGYATEAAKAAMRVGFERLALDKIVSFTAVVNRRSRAVMERLGMQEASETFRHPSIAGDSPLCEHCLYTLTAEAWKKSKD